MYCIMCIHTKFTVCIHVFTDLVAQRGEKLELLIDKTENLVDAVSLTTTDKALLLLHIF